MTGIVEKALADELAQWSKTGMVAQIWVRDDDAIAVTDELDRFDRLVCRHGGKFVIASMPLLATVALADWVEKREHCLVAQHGLAHVNRAGDGEKKSELPCSLPLDETIAELKAGHARAAELFGERFVAMLVPPWNRICPELIPALDRAGLRYLSTYGWKTARTAHITHINTHVDIIDWRGSRGGKPLARVMEDFAEALREARERGGEPVGILTHHLVHDETAHQVLDELFGLIAAHPALRWITFPGSSDSDR